MAVYATPNTGEWRCEECGSAFTSLSAVVSGTEPVCPYCRESVRITALETSHAELLEAAREVVRCPSMHLACQTPHVMAAVSKLQQAIIRSMDNKP